MAVVYDLRFTRIYPDRDDTDIRIGIFISKADAESAVEALKDKPGFREFPEGFEAHEVTLNRAEWSHGFITVIGPPPSDASGEIDDVPAFLEEHLPGGSQFDGQRFALLRKHS